MRSCWEFPGRSEVLGSPQSAPGGHETLLGGPADTLKPSMPISPSASQLARVITTLRNAGCVFAEDEARVLAAAALNPGDLDLLAARRAGGLPLEQVVGWADFCGLRITVEEGVFVPRRRSEFLVRQAAAVGRRLGERSGGRVVVDLCCGTGAIGLALAAALGEADLYAVDIDPVAVACARRNVGGHGQVYAGDLYDALPASLRGRVDLIVANAPYVPTAEIPLLPAEARLHEPQVALDGGYDGVEVHRRVAARATEWLSPAGSVLIETSGRQATLTADAVATAGLTATVVADDEWAATAVIGSRTARGQAIRLCVGGLPQLRERRREAAGAPVRVQAARVRQDPDARVAKPPWLGSHRGLTLPESRAVGGHAEDGEPSRPDLFDQRDQDPAAIVQLGGGELIGPGRGARDHIGDPESERRQQILLVRPELPVGKPALMQGRPEPVARTGEVVAGCGRVQARVDAGKQHAQVGPDHVGQRERGRGGQVGRRRPGRGGGTRRHRGGHGPSLSSADGERCRRRAVPAESGASGE